MNRPLYQRRHYVSFARSLAERRQVTHDLFGLSELDAEIARLVDTFHADNPQFQPDRFIAACHPAVVPSKRTRS